MRPLKYLTAASLLMTVAIAGCASSEEISVGADEGGAGVVAETSTTTVAPAPVPGQALVLDPTGQFPGTIVVPAGAALEPGSAEHSVMSAPTDANVVTQLAAESRTHAGHRMSADEAARIQQDQQAQLVATSAPVPSYYTRVLRTPGEVVNGAGERVVDAIDITITHGDLYTAELNQLTLSTPGTEITGLTVRGKSAIQAGPDEFGVGIGWQERPGLAVYVSLKSGNLADAVALVESMQL